MKVGVYARVSTSDRDQNPETQLMPLREFVAAQGWEIFDEYILLSMLEAVYVDTVEEKAIVAIRPKPAFRPIFEIAITREGSDVVLINEPPQTDIEPEAADSCFWWRRGRVELPVQ